MSKISSALVAVVLALAIATITNSCSMKPNSVGARFAERDLVALRALPPDERVSIIALTAFGEAKEFANVIEKTGGEIRAASEKAGLVVAEMDADEALELSGSSQALSRTTHIALGRSFTFDFESEKLNPDTGLDNDAAAVVLDRRAENAQLPTNEMGVLQFERDMKNRFGIEVNGETVKIAIVDTGLDLAHHDAFQDRVRVSWDMTKEGRVKAGPATRDSASNTVKPNGAEAPKLVLSAEMQSPSNDYFLGKIRESNYRGADFDQNGKLTDEFDLLLAKTSKGWRVSIDADRNKDFSNDPSIGDFETTRETFAMDRSRSGLVKVNVNLPLKPDGSVAKTEQGDVEVNFAGYDAGQHGTHVAGIAAGRFDGPQFAGHFRGGAPRATLFGIKVLGKNGGQDADILAGIAVAVERGVDVINMSLGSGQRPIDGLDTLSKAIDQVARRTNVLFVIASGNNGPGMTTIGAPSTAFRAISVGAAVSGDTWKTAYNVPSAIDAMFIWSFSSRGPEDTGEIRPTLLAPGSAYSSIPLARIAGAHSGYDVMQGTSMAAPAASGAIASLLDAVRKMRSQLALSEDALTLRWALVEGAKDVNELNAGKSRAPRYGRFEQGAGVLNLPAAFASLEKRGAIKAIDYIVEAGSLRATYPGSARGGLFSTMRLPETLTFTVRKMPSDPIDPTEHNFDRVFDVSSDTAWAQVKTPSIVLNGLNETPVTLAIDQEALAKLPYGVHMARIVGRHGGLQEWTFDVTYVKARELTESFDRGEFSDASIELLPGEITRYHFFVGPERTRIRASLRVPLVDDKGAPTDGRYRMIISDPTGRRVYESPSLTGANGFNEFQILSPLNGVWEIVVYRHFSAKDDATAATLRFSTESLDVDPSIWKDALGAGQTQASMNFTLMSGGRTVSPIGTVSVSRVGSTIADVGLVDKQKTNVSFSTPKGTRKLTVRTREVKNNAKADIDLALVLDGKEIATSGGPDSNEKLEADVPAGSLVTLVVDAFDLAGQPQGLVDVDVEFNLPAPLQGSTTLTGQPLARGVSKQMTASIDLTGLATSVVDDVRSQFKTVVLKGEMELFDTKQRDDTKVGSVPLHLALP